MVDAPVLGELAAVAAVGIRSGTRAYWPDRKPGPAKGIPSIFLSCSFLLTLPTNPYE